MTCFTDGLENVKGYFCLAPLIWCQLYTSTLLHPLRFFCLVFFFISLLVGTMLPSSDAQREMLQQHVPDT